MSRFGDRLRGAQPVGTWLGSGGRLIRIQRGTITLTASLTGTATLTIPADPNQSLLFHLGEEHSASEPNNSRRRAYLTFTDATTITATRIDAGGNLVVSYEVHTYAPGTFTRIQRNTVDTTQTIAAVNTARAEVTMLGWNTSAADGDCGIRIVLTNATTITATRDGNTTAAFQVAERA